MNSNIKRPLADLVEKSEHKTKKPRRYNKLANLNKSAESLESHKKKRKNKIDRKKYLEKKNKRAKNDAETSKSSDNLPKGQKFGKNKKTKYISQNKQTENESEEIKDPENLTEGKTTETNVELDIEERTSESSKECHSKQPEYSLENIEYFISSDDIQYGLHEDGILVIMPPNSRLAMKGNFQVLLISGNLNVCGYDFKHGEEQTVFSNESIILYCLAAGSGCPITEEMEQILSKMNVLDCAKNYTEGNICTIAKLRSYTDKSLDLIHQTGLFFQDNVRLRSLPDTTSLHSLSWSCINAEPILSKFELFPLFVVKEEWVKPIKRILNPISYGENVVVMVCGGMNVGKSTFARYLVNKMLSLESVKEIGYLDLDPGQPEFSFPGNLSFTSFSSPLLGPPYSHSCMKFQYQRQKLLGHLSGVDMEYNYYDLVKSLYAEYQTVNNAGNLPLIVNMMGYTETDIILSELIKIIQPSHVVNLCYEYGRNNYPVNINSESVKDRTNELVKFIPINIILQNTSPGGFRNQYINRRLGRNITFMSRMINIFDKDISANSLKTYNIKFDKTAVRVLNDNIEDEYRLLAVYQQFVAVCTVNDKFISPVGENIPPVLLNGWEDDATCHGYGYISKINLNTSSFTVVAPNQGFNAIVWTPVKPPTEFDDTFLSCNVDNKPVKCSVFPRDLSLPWFTREEWIKVCDWIYSSHVEDWKIAYQFLNVWTNRCARCDIGINLTIPMLKAKIILAEEYDNHSDITGHKKYLRKMLYERTVEIMISLLKSVTGHRYKVAEKIGIDQSINRIRNVLAHGSMKFNEQLLHKTFDQLCQYIKIQYWEKEDDLYFEDNPNDASQIQVLEKEQTDVCKNDDVSEPVALKTLRISLIKTGKFISENISSSEKFPLKLFKKKVNRCVRLFNEAYIEYPVESSTLFVSHLILRKAIKKFILKRPSNTSNSKQKSTFVACYKYIFDAIKSTDEQINQHIIEAMIDTNKEKIPVLSEWLELFFKSQNKSDTSSYRLERFEMFSSQIEWDNVICKMMASEIPEIIELSARYMSKTNIEKLNPGLCKITHLHADSLKGNNSVSEDLDTSQIFTMKDVKKLLGDEYICEDLESLIKLPFLQSLILPKQSSPNGVL